jgi:murein L,D-transpeptidase YafK
MLLPAVKYFCMAQRLINRKQIQSAMKQFRLSHFLLLFSLIALVSFTIDKGKKKKPAGKARTAKAAPKPKPVAADEEVADNYPIVFGSKDLSDKMKEGDKRTPDGQFKVVLKKYHPKWGPELLLDYPNGMSIQKFNQRKASGLIPKNAKIGDGIAIHATRPDEEWTVDNFYNWTDGCVSVKYTEMKDLFSYIPVGTKVTIQQ